MPNIPEDDQSTNFEDRTTAMGATPYQYGFGKPRSQETPGDRKALGLWVQGGSPTTPTTPAGQPPPGMPAGMAPQMTLEEMMNAQGQAPPSTATPRPAPPPGTTPGAFWNNLAVQQQLAAKNAPYDTPWGMKDPLLGGLGLRLTPVTGDPYAPYQPFGGS